MKSSSLTLSGPLRKKLSECEVGETERVTLTIKVTGTGEDTLSADVTGVEYSDKGDDAGEKEHAMPMMKPKGPKRPKALEKAIAAY